MARPPSKTPTDGELEILRVLWTKGKLNLSTLCEAMRAEREVATTTVATMLKVMLDKGLVKRTGTGRGVLWSAAVSRDRTAAGIVGKVVDDVFEGSTWRLVAHLVESRQLSDADLAELQELVNSKRTTEKEGKKGEGR